MEENVKDQPLQEVCHQAYQDITTELVQFVKTAGEWFENVLLKTLKLTSCFLTCLFMILTRNIEVMKSGWKEEKLS